MKTGWLLLFSIALACDSPNEPSPWVLEPNIAAQPSARLFPYQPATTPAGGGEVAYTFTVIDNFDGLGLPESLHFLADDSLRTENDIKTVWVRLPAEVLGYEAFFECPAPPAWLSHYSKVEIAPGINASCRIAPLRFYLRITLDNLGLELWDHTNPRIAMGLRPDDMVYEWRLYDGSMPGPYYDFGYTLYGPKSDESYGGRPL